MDLYLLRHGESQANAGLTDNLDSGLTDLGRMQAEASAERLKNVGLDAIYVSPLVRTLETVAPICRATGLPAIAYSEICEFFSPNYPGFRRFHGLSPDEIVRRFPFVRASADFPCSDAWWPGDFENDRVMYDRAVRVRDTLVRRHGATADKVLVVTHAETVGRLIEAFQGLPPDPDPPWSDNCGLSLIHWSPPGPGRLEYRSDTWHMAPRTLDATG